MKSKLPAFPYLVFMAVFILVPLLLVAYYGFTDKQGTFTLEFFRKFLEPLYLKVFARSIWLALVSTLLCLVIGYPLAMILAGDTFKKKNILIVLFIVPMWMNFLVRTYAWLTLLENNGLINSFLDFLHLPKLELLYNNRAVVMGMVYNFLPFMVLPIHSVLVKIDRSLIEAAEDLGADRLRVFSRVTLPLSVPGVLSGITMVFMPSITTFVISRLLGGGKTTLVGDVIEQQFLTVYNWNFGAAISLFMMAVILLSMALLSRIDRGKEGLL
ncbi:MAG TPA: ABC transporter permease [Clostridiales bacterium]|nr:ABC transporter permease [Clostridiales bacterium]